MKLLAFHHGILSWILKGMCELIFSRIAHLNWKILELKAKIKSSFIVYPTVSTNFDLP